MKGIKLMASILAISMIMSGLALVSAGTDTGETSVDAIDEPPVIYAGSSPRTVVVEQFTSDWCPYCPTQTHSMERLYEEYYPNGPIIIEYHTSDEFTVPDVIPRANKYAVPGIPSVIFDGGGPYTDIHLRGSGGYDKYDVYVADKADYLEETTGAGAGAPCTIDIEGDIEGLNGNLHVILDFTDVPTESSLELTTVIMESTKHHFDANTNEVYGHHRVYNGVCRDILDPIALPGGIGVGTHLEYNISFALDPAWYPDMDPRDIASVVMLQSTTNYDYKAGKDTYHNFPILQAAKHEFVDAEVLLVNGDGTDAIDDNADYIVEELVKIGVKARTWDTIEATDTALLNVKTMPTLADLQKYSTVIWYTGPDTTTLDVADRTNLQDYLIGGGNAFLTGSNIAEDANSNGWNSWLQTNFKTSFAAGDSGGTSFNGIASDPIGDGLSGLPVNTGAGTPDSITAEIGGTVCFTYDNGPNMGVRSIHSGGGRTVFFGGDYFVMTDTIDADSDDETVLTRILTWQNAAIPPEVEVTFPNGGETFAQAEDVIIRWDAHDVDIPENGIDIYYCTDYPTATWQAITTGTVNDGIHYWTTPSIDSSVCRIRVVATDSESLVTEDISNFDFTIGSGVGPILAPYDIPIPVAAGPGSWVFVSFPYAMTGDIETVLTDADGGTTWDIAKWFDANDTLHPWRTHSRNSPGLSDMPMLTNSMGIWLHLTAHDGGVLTTGIDGDYSAAPVGVTLYPGWNLVGYPSAIGENAFDSLLGTGADRIAEYQAASPYIVDESDLTQVDLAEGNAYWIHVDAFVIWTVDV